MGYIRRWLVVAVLCATALGAQEVRPKVIPDAVACSACRITVTTVVTLGTDDGPGAINTRPLGVDVDGRGRYWVVPLADGSAVPIVFASGGQLARVAGRRGEGPGEFRAVIDAVPLPGDSVLLVDNATRRGTIIGPNLEPVRFIQVPEPLQYNVVISWPDAVVGMSHYAGGGRGGPVLHAMAFDSASARVTRSFGPVWSMRDLRTMEQTVARLFQATTGIWSILPQRYRIDQWNLDGQLLAALERQPEWFGTESLTMGTRDTPPPPRFTAVAEDGAGRLWTFVAVAAPTWREGWPKDEGEFRVAAFSMEKMYRTMVEVLDLKAGQVIARRQLDYWIIGTLPEDRAVVYTVSADGFPRLRIVRYGLDVR